MNNVKEKKSINYVSRHAELQDWIQSFSAHLKANPGNNKNAIIYPEEFATGFAKVYTIEPGLTYRIVDYQLNTDLLFVHGPSKRFFLIIYFYKYINCSKLLLKINDEKIIDISGEDYSALLMTNSQLAQHLEIEKGTFVQGLTIQVTRKWIMEKMSGKNPAIYDFFKEKGVFQSFITPKSQKLLSEIFTENKSFAPALYMNNRVSRLLESFLEKVLKNSGENAYPSSSREIGKLLKVKSILLENYDAGFPNIDKLARVALMSESKLKKDFKKSFNMGMYEYYQKNRMHVAKELLTSGKFSISEVGGQVGYKNMSNFASAFKKEFNCLPKDFRKIG